MYQSGNFLRMVLLLIYVLISSDHQTSILNSLFEKETSLAPDLGVRNFFLIKIEMLCNIKDEKTCPMS